ncbi:MAG: transposase [Prevotella sp.]|jgi:transposase
MAKVRFKSYTQNEPVLFPPEIGESIPENHPVRLISRIVDGLNLSILIRLYNPGGKTHTRGKNQFHPRMLLKVIFYAYLNNIYSCREIEDKMNFNLLYMWLSGNQHPSYTTLNRFRSGRMKECVNGLFVDVVKILVEMGLVSLYEKKTDGNKMEPAVNKYKFAWRKPTLRNKAILEERIKGVLDQIDEAIAQDKAAGEESEPQREPIDLGLLNKLIDQMKAENSEPAKSNRENRAKPGEGAVLQNPDNLPNTDDNPK